MDVAERLHWYRNRLACMSAREVAWRAREQALGQLERRGLFTARRVPPPDFGRSARGLLHHPGDVDVERYRRAADRLLAGRIALFAHDDLHVGEVPDWNRDPCTGRAVPMIFGRALNYRDPRVAGNIKYLWELNRHLQLTVVAQAYRLTGEARYLHGIGRWIDSWLDQCPYLKGPNWNSALELGIRLINWGLTWQLIGGKASPLFEGVEGTALRTRWLESVYRHAHFIRRHLSRHSSANNHLIGEAAGLFAAWMAWPYWREVEEWGRTGYEVLVAEALAQNGADGVNREQAIAYQQFVLDFLLIAGLWGQANGVPFPERYWQRIEAMLEFIASIMDMGGHVPAFGDGDDGYVVRLSQEPEFCPYRSLLATGAVLFRRDDFRRKARRLDDKTRWLLGPQAEEFGSPDFRPGPLPVRRAFPEGGYYILGSDFETDREVRLVVDSGPLGYRSIAAHGHADALSFTLALGGREFLVDPGTYAYHTERRWRDYFRGTAAHNTVRIDGLDQSVIGGSFLWLKHAQARCEAWAPSDEEDYFRGSHDGYRRLPDPVLHRREVRYLKPQRKIRIIDSFTCNGPHEVELFWHFSEECVVRRSADGVTVTRDGYRIHMRPLESGIAIDLIRGDEDRPAGWISRRFDVKTPTTTMIWRLRIEGPAVVTSELDLMLPEAADEEIGRSEESDGRRRTPSGKRGVRDKEKGCGHEDQRIRFGLCGYGIGGLPGRGWP